MTDQELVAIIELFNRTPMTMAERLWTQGLINRWQSETRPDHPEIRKDNPPAPDPSE